MTDFNREMLMCAESSVDVFSEGEVGVSYCCRNQIPCLCKASLLSTVLCFPLIFHVLFSTLNLPLTHHVRSGRGWGDRSQYTAAAVCVEHCGVICTAPSGTYELAYLLFAIATFFFSSLCHNI